VSINWSKENRKAFRLALQRAYPSVEKLAMFVDEELDENLSTVASNQTLTDAAYDLIQWAEAKTSLDKLFKAFCTENPNNLAVFQAECNSCNNKLIPESNIKNKVDEENWDSLFVCFDTDDLADLKRALKIAAQATVKAQYQAQYQGIELFGFQFSSLLDIRAALERLDSYDIAVLFASEAIAQISRSVPQRNLTGLTAWRDRIAHQQGIDLSEKTPPLAPEKTGYLLVSIKPTGQSRQGIKEVILFPELHTDSASVNSAAAIYDPIQPITCNATEIGRHLSQLLYDAEETLNCEAVTLELFLAWPQIEECVADWDMVDIDDNCYKLRYRPYLLRSLDRFYKWEQRKAFRTKLSNNWQRLQACMANQMLPEHFHFQSDCPEPGQLTAALSQKVGLKLISQLPKDDKAHRKAIFNNIIESAVPMAFWLENTDNAQAASISKSIDRLLKGVTLTHFGTLAELLRQCRDKGDSSDPLICELQSFFDCPERWPISIPPESIAQKDAPDDDAPDDDSLIVSPL
jgi:hypothetical protein